MLPCCPHSHGEIERWARSFGTTAETGRLRFIKFCVLDAVASEPRLGKVLILRGSAALQLFYRGVRESGDLDFVVLNIDGGPNDGDSPDAPVARLNRMLGRVLPAHFGGNEAWEEWLKAIKIQLQQATTVYDVNRRRLTDSPDGPGAGKRINVATLEVLVAEKIVAMGRAITYQQPIRREQDVFDLADLTKRGVLDRLNLRRVAELIRPRAQEDRFEFRPALFGPKGRDLVGTNYQALRNIVGADFIPFTAAWNSVVSLLNHLPATVDDH